MDLAGIIGNSPQWRSFQAQLQALVAVVQDTNVRVRRIESALSRITPPDKERAP